MNFRSLCAAVCALSVGSAAGAVNVTGIKVTSAFGDYLQVSEIQAFAGDINVAPKGVATASSTLFGNFTGPEKANDGCNDGQPYGCGIYISAPGDSTAWLLLSFSRAYNITNVRIFGREDANQDRDLFDYELILAPVNALAPPPPSIRGSLDARGQTVTNFDQASFALAVPEPSTWAMLMGGIGVLGAAARRRRSRSAVVTA